VILIPRDLLGSSFVAKPCFDQRLSLIQNSSARSASKKRVSASGSFVKHAQDGVRRESVSNSLDGARHTLCALLQPVVEG